MTAPGDIHVRLDVADGRVRDVSIASTRATNPARVLSGRTVVEALRVVPLLFPICAHAHRTACMRATEAAAGVCADARTEARRDVACLAEAVASHLFQLAVAWPTAVKAPPHATSMREGLSLVERIQRAIAQGSDGAFDVAIEAARSLSDLVAHVVHEPCALVAAVEASSAEAFGEKSAVVTHRFRREAAEAGIANEPSFSLLPEIDGAPVDASAIATRDGATEARRQGGLLARLRARQSQARRDAHALGERLDVVRRSPGVATPAPMKSGSGCGHATTARGPLLHWVRTKNDLILEARTVAPTDWTFHPRGVVRAAMIGATANETLARDAGWFVLALDPCVTWSIEVTGA